MAWLTVDVYSETLKIPVTLECLIPQGHGKYKTLYLLHGAGGNHSSWLTKTRIADYAEYKNIAVIMPSGNNKFYVNNIYGRDYFSFISDELIKICETLFPLLENKNDRFIAGMSMGGYGAINCALECPEKYAIAFSYSGLMNILERYDNPRGIYLEPIFGDREKILTQNNDILKKVHKNKEKFSVNVDNSTEFRLYCGLSDKLLIMTQQMYKEMLENNYKVECNLSQGGHEWEYWDRCICETLQIIDKGAK